jgi:hypothetical protein
MLLVFPISDSFLSKYFMCFLEASLAPNFVLHDYNLLESMSLHHHKSSPLLNTLVMLPNSGTFIFFVVFFMFFNSPLVNPMGFFEMHSRQVQFVH